MVRPNIPYGRQGIDKLDIKKVINVLNSDYQTSGPTLKLLEKKSYCNSKFSVATNSATSALHIACKAIGLKKGDIVRTTPITFVSSANCALYCGALVDFVDIDLDTFNISIESLKEKLIFAKKKKTSQNINSYSFRWSLM